MVASSRVVGTLVASFVVASSLVAIVDTAWVEVVGNQGRPFEAVDNQALPFEVVELVDDIVVELVPVLAHGAVAVGMEVLDNHHLPM